MKTHTFIIWMSLLILFPHGLFSKSLTNKEQYSLDSENLNDNSEGSDDVALHETFRPRHKYKANGHQTRFYRSESESNKDQAPKAPQCAVMYKDNEPVGILQPFKESYRFLPVNGDPTLVDINPIPVKRKTIMDVLYPSKINEDYDNDEIPENNNKYADDRYPSIFAKFKIDSRLDKTMNPDLNLKRSMYKRDTERPDISDEQVSSLKTTLSKMNGDNSAVVEEELKNILDDMGLIDDYDAKGEAKREVAEDENMEQGTNKINLIKEEHNETRNKRGDINTTTVNGFKTTDTTQPTTSTATTMATTTTSTTTATTLVMPTKVQFEEEHTEEIDSIDLFKGGDAKLNDDSEKEELVISTETDLELRKRRQFNPKEDDQKENKREDTNSLPDPNLNTSSLVKEVELNQYEKRVEREIRDKIKKLKEEVKEEIDNLKKTPTPKNEEFDTRRKKRQVLNTLVDEESQDIDPNLNEEDQHEEHHVRRKRSLDDSTVIEIFDDNNNVVKLSSLNDEQKVKHQKQDKNVNTLEIPNEKLKTSKQINNNSSYFVINFGNVDVDYDINKVIRSNSLGKENKQHSAEKEDIFGNSTAKITKRINVNDNTLQNGKEGEGLASDLDLEGGRIPNLGKNITHNSTCKNKRCSACHKCHRSKKRIHVQNKTLSNFKTKKSNGDFKKVKRDINRTESRNSSMEAKKKNIINILNVIGKKTYNTDGTNSQVNDNTNNSSSVLKLQLPSKIMSKALIVREKNAIDYGNKTSALKRIRNNDSYEKIINIRKRKRFIGINPILEGNISSTKYYRNESLKQTEDITTELNSEADRIEHVVDDRSLIYINPNTTNATDHYRSRSLKQFEGDTVKDNLENGVHIRGKRSEDEGTVQKNSLKRYMRRKRQSNNDLEENEYQYDDSGFNEDSVGENQVYDDQPYASDNNVADNMQSGTPVNNVNSNCNCDKTGNGCKCGTQKNELSVPNIKQDYTEYVESPSRNIEKKSIKHCNCDKNGQHCNCQTFGESSQYPDYAEEEESDGMEDKSADLEEDNTPDEPQGVEERAPRKPRQRKYDEYSRENSNAEDIAEDYYETEGSRLTKREAKQRKFAGNQQFQNGEYFVDLHPSIYRLTPVDTSREKRDNFKDLVAIHGGGPVMSHLVAIKQRSMLPHLRIRRRVQTDDNKEPRQLIDMSDEDIFGALPQSFAGELARYKRVKRSKNDK